MNQTLVLDPEEVRAHPVVADPAHPKWAEQLLTVVREAAEHGQAISVSTRVKTLTPAEIAERLGVSRTTISRRIASGQIKALRVGNRHRVPVAEYDRFRRELMNSVAEHYAADLEVDLFGGI
ncbi:MAG: helix-turn-helix domain-containing protein [Micrococcales bacterium]|nr:helix-turn-helix domain-containing protein [Micrococcales bacterium]